MFTSQSTEEVCVLQNVVDFVIYSRHSWHFDVLLENTQNNIYQNHINFPTPPSTTPRFICSSVTPEIKLSALSVKRKKLHTQWT